MDSRLPFAILVTISLGLLFTTTLAKPASAMDFGQLESGIIEGDAGNPDLLKKLVSRIVNLVVAITVGVGLIWIVIAGYVYMTAGGNASQVEQAKTIIVAALAGIVLALMSYTLLNFINPDLVGKGDTPSLQFPD